MAYSLKTHHYKHPVTGRRLFAAFDPESLEPVELINGYISQISNGLSDSSIESHYFAVKKFHEYITIGIKHIANIDTFERQPVIVTLVKNYVFYLAEQTAYNSQFNIDVHTETGHNHLSGKSLEKEISHLNKFIAESQNVFYLKVDKENEQLAMLNKLDFHSQLLKINYASSFQEKHMRTDTLLGSVIKQSRVVGIKKYFEIPRFLKAKGSKKLDQEKLYPISKFNELLSAAELREQLIYLLQGGGGLRSHEAIQIRLDDIVKGILKIRPYEDRSRMDSMTDVQLSHMYKQKGRNTEDIYWIPGFEKVFYERLAIYFQVRTDLLHKGGITEDHGFIFLKSRDVVGRPFYEASRVSQDVTFKNLNSKIGLSGHTRHSLRHMYGTFMGTQIPLPDGRKGFPPETLMKMMGHANLKSSLIYRHIDVEAMEENLKFAASILLNGS